MSVKQAWRRLPNYTMYIAFAVVIVILVVIGLTNNKDGQNAGGFDKDTFLRDEARNNNVIDQDFARFSEKYKSMTQIQQDAYWNEVNGKPVQWTGKVKDVTATSIIVSAAGTFEAKVSVDQLDKLNGLTKGSEITVRGALSTPGTQITPWVINESTVVFPK